jgi:hypothetical protein
MPFQKVISGNPGGRPKKREQVIEIEPARKYPPQAMEALVKIATSSKSDSARVAAAIAILNRVFGRPRQTLQAQSELNFYYRQGVGAKALRRKLRTPRQLVRRSDRVLERTKQLRIVGGELSPLGLI